MLRLHRVALGLLLFSSWTVAQDSGVGDQATISLLAEQLKELQTQTSGLQERIRALEAEKTQTSTTSPEPAAASPAAQTKSRSDTEAYATITASLHDLHGIRWRGFGEFNYKVLDQRQPELGTFGFEPGSAGNFYSGDFDLFLTSKISDRASVLSEIVFGEGTAQSFNVDLERVLLKYDYNDHLKMSFGRYHTGIGYYNTAFHSGKWMQVAADRPLIMEFAAEGGLLPTQAIGVSVTGFIPSGKLGLNYLFEYGSSDTVRPSLDGLGSVDDENNGNHINIGLFVRPEAFPGLQVGGSFYHDKISDSAVAPSVRIGQTIVNAHIVYVAHGIEILNEGFLIRHAPENRAIAFNMPAFYSQFSKRFGHVRPFFRYQYVNTNKESTVFDDVGQRFGPSFGARYDFDDDIAFKLQLDHTVRRGRPDLNGLQTQLAYTF